MTLGMWPRDHSLLIIAYSQVVRSGMKWARSGTQWLERVVPAVLNDL